MHSRIPFPPMHVEPRRELTGLNGHSAGPFNVSTPTFSTPNHHSVVRRLHLRLHPPGNHRRVCLALSVSFPVQHPRTLCFSATVAPRRGCRATRGGGKVDGARVGHAPLHCRQNFAGYIRECPCPSASNTGVATRGVDAGESKRTPRGQRVHEVGPVVGCPLSSMSVAAHLDLTRVGPASSSWLLLARASFLRCYMFQRFEHFRLRFERFSFLFPLCVCL